MALKFRRKCFEKMAKLAKFVLKKMRINVISLKTIWYRKVV